MNNTETILAHHLTAFGNNNLDEIMMDYTEQSTLLTDNGELNGLDKIRHFFTEMFRLIPTDSEFEMKQFTIKENVAHIIWASKSNVANIPLGSDTFILENDKIKFHSVVAYINNTKCQQQ